MPGLEELTEQVESVIAQLEQPGVHEIYVAYLYAIGKNFYQSLASHSGGDFNRLEAFLGDEENDTITDYRQATTVLENALIMAMSGQFPRTAEPRDVLASLQELKKVLNSYFLHILSSDLTTAQLLHKRRTPDIALYEMVTNTTLLDEILQERFPTRAGYENQVRRRLALHRQLCVEQTMASDLLGVPASVTSQRIMDQNTFDLYEKAQLKLTEQECNRIYGAQPQT